jgi:hypothetical protein
MGSNSRDSYGSHRGRSHCDSRPLHELSTRHATLRKRSGDLLLEEVVLSQLQQDMPHRLFIGFRCHFGSQQLDHVTNGREPVALSPEQPSAWAQTMRLIPFQVIDEDFIVQLPHNEPAGPSTRS